MTTMKNNQALGVLGWMAMIGDTHNRLTVTQFLEKLRMALQQGHLEVLHRQHKPVAWLIWQQPKEQAWKRHLMSCGDARTDPQALEGQVWLDFWVRPFGCDTHLAQLVGQCLLNRGLAHPKLCWHDPCVDGGLGRLNLGVSIENLQGK
jgi:hemolysin-activating ACP:hemolysin acyltransferase